MTEPDWDDLKLFLHVALTGGLSGASERTGISAPTIGRRMLALERATGRTLFVRSQRGYRLAPDGEVLLAHVQAMQTSAEKIADWRGQAFTLPIVSIGADAWLSVLIADETPSLRGATDPFRLCCQLRHAGIDFTYRETDIGPCASLHRPATSRCANRCPSLMPSTAPKARPALPSPGYRSGRRAPIRLRTGGSSSIMRQRS